MSENNQTTNEKNSDPLNWDKLVQGFWHNWKEPMDNIMQAFWTQGEEPGRVSESFGSSMKMWQTMMEGMATPEAMENFQKVVAVTPDIALGFAQTCLQGFTRVQEQAGEWMVKRGASFSATDIQDLDNELIKNLQEIYEKEFSRYLKLPQVGMGRLYQERLLHALDKMNVLQLVLSDFTHMLYLPVEKSLNSLQKEMARMAESGDLDEKSKTYYDLWIKLLEGHYMELFKEPEYAEAMGKTMSSLNDFVEARQAVINDVLLQLNIPSSQDLDELSKEIYLLKKRVRVLENK